jgi:hypothetical protein
VFEEMIYIFSNNKGFNKSQGAWIAWFSYNIHSFTVLFINSTQILRLRFEFKLRIRALTLILRLRLSFMIQKGEIKFEVQVSR